MLGQLVPCAGGKPIPLLKPTLLVGRRSSSDIPLPFPSISSRHCELTFLEGYWHVKDLGSTNGVRVNGTRCESQPLLPDDALALAGYRFTIVYDAPPGSSPPFQGPEYRRRALGPAEWRAGETGKVGSRVTMMPRAAESALGQLVPCGGGAPIPLRKPSLLVGRHERCDIVLCFTTVSSQHCKLEWTEGSWLIRDLGSRNGTRVDGLPITAQKLESGSVLDMAGQRFLLVYGAGQTASPAEPKAPLFGQSLLEAAGLADWRPKQGRDAGADEEGRGRWTLGDPG
jgi:adenylate cyclase